MTLLVFTLFAGNASAASFVSTPPTMTSGAGPFDFAATRDDPHQLLAYKLPTETGWHRCQTGTPVRFSLSNLPDGTYTVQIADDITRTSSQSAPDQCNGSDAPTRFPISTFTFTIKTPAPGCPTYKAKLHAAKRRLTAARAAYARDHFAPQRRAVVRARASVRKWQRIVARDC